MFEVTFLYFVKNIVNILNCDNCIMYPPHIQQDSLLLRTSVWLRINRSRLQVELYDFLKNQLNVFTFGH